MKLEESFSQNIDERKKVAKATFEFVTFKEIRDNLVNLIRSSSIGTFIGIVPATGSGTASYVAYNEAKRFSSDKSSYGTGNLQGLAATESANNAVTGGALIPLLTLGIPGDVVTAVLLGGLLLQGVAPGPLLFENSPEITNLIYISLLIANVFMLVIGLSATKVFAKIVNVPASMMMPIVVILCVLGSYSINNNEFDVITMLGFGLLGYLLEKFGFPLPPLLLGFILSPLIEENFRKSMLLSRGEYDIFFDKPISASILLVTFIIVASVIYKALMSKRDNVTPVTS